MHARGQEIDSDPRPGRCAAGSLVTAEIAQEFDVDEDMLRTRVDIVHPAEAAVLRRAVAHHQP